MLAERRRVLRSGGPILGCRARDASGTFMAWLLIVLFLFSDKGEKEDGFMACHVRKSMANRWRRNLNILLVGSPDAFTTFSCLIEFLRCRSGISKGIVGGPDLVSAKCRCLQAQDQAQPWFQWHGFR